VHWLEQCHSSTVELTIKNRLHWSFIDLQTRVQLYNKICILPVVWIVQMRNVTVAFWQHLRAGLANFQCDLACGTLFRSSCAIQILPMDCSDVS